MSYSVRNKPADVSNYDVGREGKSVTKIIIHHAATTSFDGIAATFANPSRNASAHYGVGQNGNVDKYVDEANTAWHAGNWDVNLTSIGIEHVNSSGAPNWNVASTTKETSIELVRDIAKRHNLLPLVVGKNLFGHKDVSLRGTACPMTLEPWLQKLADVVNNGETVKKLVKPQPDQVLHVGEKFKFPKVYRVDDLQKIGGIWQVRTNELCPIDFSWNDNGIPVGPLKEVAGGVGKVDQVLQKGAKYTIPGTFTVLDLGAYKGRWMAKIKMGVWSLWVDVATVREV